MSEALTQIDLILAEPIEAARKRERDAIIERLRRTDGSVVLHGAGRLGHLCADALRAAGIPLRAVCDNSPARQGTRVGEQEVLSVSTAVARYGERSLFVVAIWSGTGTESVREHVDHLRASGAAQVESFAPVLWRGAPERLPFHGCDLPSRELARADEYRRLARRLADEESRDVLLAALRQRILGVFSRSQLGGTQYFPAFIRPVMAESFVDGGAFDGDTLATFLSWSRKGFARYHAFEPDPLNLPRLRARVAALPAAVRERVEIHPLALHARAESLTFASEGTPAARVGGEQGAVRVDGRPLDEVLAGEPVTFLKLDVEGAEGDALNGAQRVLHEREPVAAVCVYHRAEDLANLAFGLADALPRHGLFLRAHGHDGWETVVYAAPPERIRLARPCPVCASAGRREILHRQRFEAGPLGDGYMVVHCAECGAAFADGIPTQELMDRYYAERSKYTYAHADGAESPYDVRRFEAIVDQIEGHFPNRDIRILDIGCATGGLLAALRRRGYRSLMGSDPAAACADAARRHGIEVRTATITELERWTERFELVLLVGVLEHLRDVREALRVVRSLLGPAGVVYCAQPDVAGFWKCVNAPFQQFSVEHVNFFSRDSLSRVMAAEGFTSVATWQWMVEWREGVIDSVISGLFRPGAGGPLRRDEASAPAIRAYVAASTRSIQPLVRQVETWVHDGTPLFVWGTGSLTRFLLAHTRLRQAPIVAFVDNDVAQQGTSLAGRPVIAPKELVGRTEPIVVASKAFEREIISAIRGKWSLKNALVTLNLEPD